MKASKSLLSGAEAWLKISRKPRFFFGLCYEIKLLLRRDLISWRTASNMDACVRKLIMAGRSYIWEPGKAHAERRKLAAFLAKGKYAEARRFVKEEK